MNTDTTTSDFSVPVIVAVTRPFRLIPIDSTDLWNADLEQINKCTFDYVRLNRTSAAIDAGIRPFNVIVGYDGTLLLPALLEYRDPYVALDVFNRVLLALVLGGIYYEAATPDDLATGTLLQNGYCRLLDTPSGPDGVFHTSARSGSGDPLDTIRLLDPDSVLSTQIRDSHAKEVPFSAEHQPCRLSSRCQE